MRKRTDLPDPERGELISVRVLGAARGVTGSLLLLETPEARLIVDCGMFQGGREQRERNAEEFPLDPRTVDAALLTHAHIDHSGRLPLLVQRAFNAPIHCTEPTADLVKIMLRDSAHIQEGDAERRNRYRARRGAAAEPPRYDLPEAEEAIWALVGSEFGVLVAVAPAVAPGVEASFRYAGRILGAACIELHVTHAGATRTLLFSGDLGCDGMPLIPGPEPLCGADLVFMESTHGGRKHPSRADAPSASKATS